MISYTRENIPFQIMVILYYLLEKADKKEFMIGLKIFQ